MDEKFNKILEEFTPQSLVDYDKTKRDAFEILEEHGKQIEEIKRDVEDLKRSRDNIETYLKILEGRFEINEDNMKKINGDIDKIQKEEREIMKNVESMMRILNSDAFKILYENAQKLEQEVEKMKEIDDEYKKAFYIVIRTQLNCFYTASQTISTDLFNINISVKKRGKASNFFSFLGNILRPILGAITVVAPYAVAIGIGIEILARLLAVSAEAGIKLQASTYLSLACSHNDMDEKISSKLAIELSRSSNNLIIVELWKKETFFDKIGDVLEKTKACLEPKTLRKIIKEGFEDIFNNHTYDKDSHDAEIKRKNGTNAATLLVGIIIAKIYKGDVNSKNLDEYSQTLLGYIKGLYYKPDI